MSVARFKFKLPGSRRWLRVVPFALLLSAFQPVRSAVVLEEGGTVIDGVTNTWSLEDLHAVGYTNANQTMTIMNGGVLQSSETTIGSATKASNCVVLVTGAASTWNLLWYNAGDLIVGANANGCSLTISNGGQVMDWYAKISVGAISGDRNNSVLVTGHGSAWISYSPELQIGMHGRLSSMTVAAGGYVRNRFGYLGYYTDAIDNSAWVSGTDSLWDNTDELYLGYSGRGNHLTISEGGCVTCDSGFVGYLAASSNNNVLVTGANSRLISTNEFFVGSSGNGNGMVISNGGAVVCREGGLGLNSASSNNTVLVTGVGSTWVASTVLDVGEKGADNCLTIADSGMARATNMVVGASASATGNRLVVEGGNLTLTNSSRTGVLDVRRGVLDFTGGNIVVDRLVASNGAGSVVNFNGGVLRTRGALVNNGSKFVVGDGIHTALYHADGGSHFFAEGLAIAGESKLAGSGAVNITTVEADGSIDPGFGFNPGTLTFGALTLSNHAIIVAEMASPVLYDKVVATNLTVAGPVLLDVSLSAPMVSSGTVFTLVDVGSYAGGETADWFVLSSGGQLKEGDVLYLEDGQAHMQPFRMSYTGNDGNDVTLMAIPEPGVAGLLAALSLTFTLGRRLRSVGRRRLPAHIRRTS